MEEMRKEADTLLTKVCIVVVVVVFNYFLFSS